MKKTINIPHNSYPVNCMWSGPEDWYCWRTKEKIEIKHLFFALSGLGNFAYFKNMNMPMQKTVFWSNGLTNKMYEFLQGPANFKFKRNEGNSFKFALNQLKKSIDEDLPVVIGAIDMYHLPYFEKFYHKIHIPIHHVLIIGYNDETQEVQLLDCDRKDPQKITYLDLQKAWDINLPGYSKKNTFYTFNFKKAKKLKELTYAALEKKAKINLNPPIKNFGISGIRLLKKEFPKWNDELSEKQYNKCILNIVEFAGFPPSLPPKLVNQSDNSAEHAIEHKGGREVLSRVLKQLSKKYDEQDWNNAANMFMKSGEKIEDIVEILSEHISNPKKTRPDLQNLLSEIADLEEDAYTIILNSKKRTLG